MAFRSDYPYENNVYIVKRYNEHTAKIIFCKSVRQKGWEDEQPKTKRGYASEIKESCNISRARSRVRELALCNPWDWWCTFTIDKEKYNRYELGTFRKDYAEFIHNLNRRRPEEDKIKYLFVPEQHKDGAWHIHGFIKGLSEKEVYKNKYRYWSWKPYEDRFGFISMSKIKNLERTASYVQKYISKDLENSVSELNKHIYFSSQGLKCADLLFQGQGIFKGSWDWEHEDGYSKIKNIDLRKETIEEFLEVE